MLSNCTAASAIAFRLQLICNCKVDAVCEEESFALQAST